MIDRQSWSWGVVRQWLLHLAREVDAGVADGTPVVLGIDHVWANADGRAWILDFRAPGVHVFMPKGLPISLGTIQRFLGDIANRALPGQALWRLPLSAKAFLQKLVRAEFAAMSQIVTELAELSTRPEQVTRQQRSMTLALGVVGTYLGTTFLVQLVLAPYARIVGKWLLPITIGGLGLSLYATIAVLCSALLCSGVWLRAFGIVVVTGDGTPVSRWRATIRAIVAWTWVPILIFVTIMHWERLASVAGLGAVLGVSYAARHPDRGLQDRLTGTHLVPR
jgi:hypothetical protein